MAYKKFMRTTNLLQRQLLSLNVVEHFQSCKIECCYFQ